MLKKTISYTDYNGVEREEDFYFNISKLDLMAMNFSHGGKFDDFIKKLIDTDNQAELFNLFKEFVLKAYGKKSEDGKRFIKSKEISEEFAQTPAFEKLIFELGTNDKEASDFMMGVIPTDVTKEAVNAVSENKYKPPYDMENPFIR